MKRFLSIVLVLTMLLSMLAQPLAVQAFAEGNITPVGPTGSAVPLNLDGSAPTSHLSSAAPLPDMPHDTLASLLTQLGTLGIETEPVNIIYPSGTVNDIRVSYELVLVGQTAFNEGDTVSAQVRFSLSAAATTPVSFQYEAIPASATLGQHLIGVTSGTVTFAVGETERTVPIDMKPFADNPGTDPGTANNADAFWTGERYFHLYCDNISGALFEGDRYTLTVPVPIRSAYNLQTVYQSAISTALIDLDTISGANAPGIYTVTGGAITALTLTAEIAGDVRTMLDAGVLSHIRMPEGYFLNETGATGTIGTKVETYRSIDDVSPISFISHSVTMPDPLGDPPPTLPYKTAFASAGFPQIQPVNNINLGPLSFESNGINRRLDFVFDTSSLSAPISICFLDNQDTYLRHQIRFSDDQAPEVRRVDIDIPSGIRYGDLVPVTIVFNEPVRTDNITLSLEGTTISPLEVDGTISNAVSFLYEAGDSVVGDSNLTVTIDSISGAVDLSGEIQVPIGPFTSNSAAVVFNSPDPEQDLAYCAEPVVSVNQGTNRNATATIAIPVQRDGNLSNWLRDRKDSNNISTAFKARVIAATSGAIDVPLTIQTDDLGTVTGFSGSFTAPENTTGADVVYAMELYLDKTGAGTFSRIHALDTLYTVPPLFLIDDATDISLDYAHWPPTDTISADGAATLSLGYNLHVAASWQDAAYFSWTSSNTAVASINNTGIITLTGTPGTATFSLTVTNPLLEPSYTVTSRTLTVQASQAAYLYVPTGLAQQDRLRGNDVAVDFATNLHDRNALYAGQGTETDFTFTLYRAAYSGDTLGKGAELFTETLAATVTAPRSTYAVDSEYLRDSTPKGIFGYVLEIRAEDRQTGQTRSADVSIRVRDLPATAALVRPEKRYMTDAEGAVTVRFDIENKTATTEYLLSVTRNSESTPVYTSSHPAGIGQPLSVPVPDVEAGRLLDVYTVTLKARNPSDETWSYDSYLFYVYSHAALEIFVNGFPNPRNMTVQADFPDGVVAYYTDIWWHTSETGLTDRVGINKTEYAWSSIADKITWSVDGDSVSLWVGSGGVRERITAENGIHLPGTNLTLQADEAGQSVVTATHALTGMSDRLTVNVNPIHDKLFMFQAYPPMPCNIRYTNGDGVARSYTTTTLGQLTVYESSGIDGEVLFHPTGDNQEIYDYGVLRSGKLTATQQTVGRFTAYPRNIVLLPQRQYRVSLSLQNQETGAPYTGPIVLRGGLYLNDTYQSQTAVNGTPGNADQTISADTNGRYTIDLGATGVTDNHELKPEDRVSYVLEARFPDNAYRPVFIRIDAREVWENRASPFGVDRLQAIHPINENAIQNSVIVVSEELTVNDESMTFEATNYVDDIIVTADLALELIVSGGYRPSYEVGLVDETGAVRSLTRVERSEAYPFADTTILSGTTDMKNGLHDILRHYNDPGTRFNLYPVIKAPGLEIRLSKPVQIQNLINVPMMATGLADSFADTEALLTDVQAGGYYPVDDGFVGDALDFLSNYDMDFGKTAGLEIIPTDDPLVYKGIFRFAVGTYDRDNPSGIFVASGEDQKFRYTPGFSDMKAMKKGVFLQKSKATMKKFKDTSKGFYYSYGGGAYVECEIFYDVGKQEWMMRLLTSDTYIGGGGGYYYNINGSIGPVPVTATLKAGMTATVGLKIVTEEDGATTYITYLYPGTNIYVFGGIGFDYDVVSFKAGPYGMIEHNQEYYWVNNNERNGQRFSIYGEVGIEFKVKLLILEYNAKWKWGDDDDSWYYGDWGGIYYDYFIPREVKEAIYGGWPSRPSGSSRYLSTAGLSGTEPNTGTDGQNVMGTMAQPSTGATGFRFIPVEQSVSFEGRDYLTAGERVWLSVPADDGLLRAGTAFSLLSAPSDVPETGITDIWLNAYPHANPVLTGDGALLAYLSDMGSTNLMDTAACFSDKTDGAFPEGTQIDASAYPDSNLALAGTAASAVAVWNRTFTSDIPAAGSNATAEDLLRTMSATEVMAGVRRDGVFHTTRLTDNATPDLAPTVAAAGDRAIALWRAVSPGDLSSPLDFTSDTIQYRIYNGTSSGTGWQETRVLYDGSLNKATGVNAAMLSDGRAAVVYQVIESDGSGSHIACSVLNADGTMANTLRVSDLAGTDIANLAPLVTTARFPDGEQRFVVGWQVTDGSNDSNGSEDADEASFRLAAVNADGSAYPAFGLTLAGDMGAAGHPRFTRGAQDIEDLSIIWTETDLDADYAPDGTRRDRIMGRKLVRAADGTLSATGRLLLESLAPYTTVESFDPVVDSVTGRIHTALLQTVHGATSTTAVMANAVSQYRNTLIVTPAFAHEDVLPGLELPVQFTVANEGVEAVKSLSITLDGVTDTFTDVNIAPDETRGLTLLRVPASPVADMTYTVTARYPTLADASQSGVLNLSLPDAGIQSVSLSRETGRERGFHLLLENNASGDLIQGRHMVRLEVYDSPNFTLPGYDGTPLYTRVISDTARLGTLNTEPLPVNIALDTADLESILTAEGEIPAGGTNLYFRTVLLENGVAVEDADPANDMAYRRIRSLVENAGTAVSLSSLMESENGRTRVRVEAFNNAMSPIANGNLIISLKDAGGRVLETRQTYRAAEPGSLLAIAGESAGSADMTFPQAGASVDVTFSRVATDSTQLSALNLLGVPISFNKTLYSYDIQTYDLTQTVLTAVAENPSSTISTTLNGSPVSPGQPIALRNGLNTFIITVATGTVVLPYVVNVTNQIGSGETPDQDNDDDEDRDATNDDTDTYRARLSLPGLTTSLEIVVDNTTGRAVIHLGEWARTFFQNDDDALLTLPTIPGVTSYTCNVPADAMAGAYGKAALTVQTALGSLRIPSGMLAGMTGLDGKAVDLAGKTAGLTIANGNIAALSALSAAERSAIGNRPLLALNLTLDGVPTDWNNPAAPVTVRIPYTPTADELKNPESLVIWYIDNAGRVVAVPNGHYDAETGTVVFHTTHFSAYAVAYNSVSFQDVPSGTWYETAVRFIAARDITKGTGGGQFSPNTKLTRGDFLVMLMRSHGIEPDATPSINFADAGNTYYTGYLAAAKALGISAGVGDNRFAPEREITRQEMFTLLYNALKAIGQLPQSEPDMESTSGAAPGTDAALSPFSDAADISPWATKAMAQLVRDGIINGSNGSLMPLQGTTRAEMAQVLYNLLGIRSLS